MKTILELSAKELRHIARPANGLFIRSTSGARGRGTPVAEGVRGRLEAETFGSRHSEDRGLFSMLAVSRD